jgi:hypothetical protein
MSKRSTTRVRHAPDLDDAAFEERFVAGEVITDELAGPGAEERSGMMAAAALGEVSTTPEAADRTG